MIKVMKPSLSTMDTRTTRPRAKQVDEVLRTDEHEIWRREVIRRADYRCEATEDGIRCGVVRPARLFADHIVERRDGGDPFDPRNGQCLCGSHHTKKTAEARRVRLSARY